MKIILLLLTTMMDNSPLDIISDVQVSVLKFNVDDFQSVNFYDNRSLKILYLNARSLRNKRHPLEYILRELNYMVDLIIITETWFKNDEPEFKIPNFMGYFANRPNKTGGGVAIFINKRVKYDSSKIRTFSNDMHSYVSVVIKCSDKLHKIIGFYRPPSMNDEELNDFYDILGSVMSNSEIHTELFGDFHFNILNEHDERVQTYANFMRQAGSFFR